jgi:uncharacterized caspase-like protein
VPAWNSYPTAIVAVLIAGAALAQKPANVVHSDHRVALVIGNDAYRGMPLRNAVNDARGMAAKLKRRSFAVTLLTDVDAMHLELGVETFVRTLKPGDNVVIYYSGHGMQIDDENYLIPIDFSASTSVEAKYKSFPLSKLQERLDTQRTQRNIIILDACRDNPFVVMTRSIKRGLAGISWSGGNYIAYATAPGLTASDNPEEDHGLFTKHLLAQLSIPYLDINELFDRVRIAVYAESNHRQMPWIASALVGPFVFTEVEISRADSEEKSTEMNPSGAMSSGGSLHEVATAPTVADRRNPATHVVRGLNDAQRHELKAATDELTVALRIDPQSVGALRERGRLLLLSGDNRGLLDLDQAIQLNPNDLASRYLLVLGLAVWGRFDDALEQVNGLISAHPEVALPYLARAALYSRAKRYDEAVEDCDRALRLNPNSGPISSRCASISRAVITARTSR